MSKAPDRSLQQPGASKLRSANATPNHLIVAAFIVILFAGPLAARGIYPESWWVKTFFSESRFPLWLVAWIGVLCVAERWLVSQKWYSKSWLAKELGRKRPDLSSTGPGSGAHTR